MNLLHRWLCRSGYWKRNVEQNLLPWALDGVDLGDEVLEVGPGPGVTTELVRKRIPRLTCVEIDTRLAKSLADRTRGSNVRVVQGDATSMGFADASYSGAVCFTMLHHVPSAALQDRLLAEVYRVLEPGGVFVGTDSIWRWTFGLLHVRDTMVLVDPATFGRRLENVGFSQVSIDVAAKSFRFRAARRGKA